MVMAYFTKRRRDRLFAEPLSLNAQRTLHANLAFYSRLSAGEQPRLADLARVMIREKRWEGCGGLVLTDDMKLIIAAQAALLLLGMHGIDLHRDAVFPNVKSILVYPAGFVAMTPHLGAAGIITEGHANLGEAHFMGQTGGPVIVSWRDALEGGLDAGDGRNLILHEFAHKLDFLDGASNGTPLLDSKEQYVQWKRVMTAHFDDLVRRARAGAPSLLDFYGASNPAEFFAVATEAFFERSTAMRQYLPELYRVLGEYFWQDPAART